MNSRTGQFVSILLMLALLLIWSRSILSAETEPTDTAANEVERVSVQRAEDATAAAADEAVESLASDVKLDLEIELNGRRLVRLAAK